VEVLRKACGGTAQSVVEAIFANLDGFQQSAASFDDQTLVVFKVL
jgi:serine phosphatase RsbU (regulator of sigma subunit)